MSNIQDLFEDIELGDTVDGMALVDINMDDINEESKKDAAALVENLSKLYCNEEFMRAHPNFKKRVDTELESLRVLIKMRKTDEVAHDLIINAIAGNSGNASLYKSLAEIQKTILSITTKMGDIITGLNNLLKGYQLELNFDQEETHPETNESNLSMTTTRGSKEFIERMNSLTEEELFAPDTQKEEGE